MSLNSKTSAESCEDWFASLKIDTNDSDCEMKCAMADSGMGSFDCPARCESLCKALPKCKLDQYWEAKLSNDSKPFAKLVLGERDQVAKALLQMPASFKPNKLKAIVRASGVGEITSISSPATSSDEYIILFPKAFRNPDKLPRVILHELTHFLITNEWQKQFDKYKEISGWNDKREGKSYREGSFMEPDGKFSPEEDMAENLEYFVFDPDLLKKTSPKFLLGLNLTLESLSNCRKGAEMRSNWIFILLCLGAASCKSTNAPEAAPSKSPGSISKVALGTGKSEVDQLLGPTRSEGKEEYEGHAFTTPEYTDKNGISLGYLSVDTKTDRVSGRTIWISDSQPESQLDILKKSILPGVDFDLKYRTCDKHHSSDILVDKKNGVFVGIQNNSVYMVSWCTQELTQLRIRDFMKKCPERQYLIK